MDHTWGLGSDKIGGTPLPEKLGRSLLASRRRVFTETWSDVDGKGIDDLLANGKFPERLPFVSPGARALALEMLPASKFLDRPRPQWTVETILQVGTTAVLYGAPGHGKSFLALDPYSAPAW